MNNISFTIKSNKITLGGLKKLIEKLKSFIEENNKEIREKLITEINVESSENNILVQSFLTKDFKDKIKEQLESIYRYIERYMVIKI